MRNDFSGLQDLRRKMAELGTPSARAAMSRVLGEAAAKQIQDEFRESRDPYGNPWAPLTSRTGQPLRKDGHLLASLAPKSDEHGFTVTTNRPGAAVHQYGAVIRAKNGKALRFGVEGAMRVFGGRYGTVRLKKPQVLQTNIVFAQKVTIPRRQYMPEGDVGPIWRKGLEDAATDFMAKRFGGGA